VKQKRQIDEIRAVIRGDRERALARLRAEGREPLFPPRTLEGPSSEEPFGTQFAAGEPPTEPEAVALRGREAAAEEHRGQQSLGDELAADEPKEKPVTLEPLRERSPFARLLAIFRRNKN
jgi:hypothetical protein